MNSGKDEFKKSNIQSCGKIVFFTGTHWNIGSKHVPIFFQSSGNIHIIGVNNFPPIKTCNYCLLGCNAQAGQISFSHKPLIIHKIHTDNKLHNSATSTDMLLIWQFLHIE